MKARTIGLAALATMAFAGASQAQPAAMVTQTPNGTVIVAPAPGIPPRGVVDRVVPMDHPPTTGSVGTTGPGCASTETQQDEADGSRTTVRQERCMR